MQAPRSYLQKLERFLSGYWLPVGYLVLLTGLFWLPERSLYSRSFYALLAVPALLASLISPRNSAQWLREPIVLCFLLFAAWLLVSLAWSHTDRSHLAQAKRPLYVLMLFAACAAMAVSRAKASLDKTLFCAAIIATLAATYGMWLYASAPDQERLIGSGSLSNPLLTSHLLGMFCTYWLARWICAQRHQVLAIACAPVLLAAVLATGSRTPLLALAAASLWLAGVWRTRRAVLSVAALAAGTLLLIALAPDMFTQRGLSYRPEIWSEALRQIMEAPWLGKGYASTLSIPVRALNTEFSDPHNVELAVALKLGVVGLLLWCLMYAAALACCIRHRASAEFAIASALLIYGLMAGMTEGSNFLSRPNESWFLTWIPLTLIAGLSIRKRLEQTCR